MSHPSFSVDGYVVVKQMISEELASFLGGYSHRREGADYKDGQCDGSASWYGEAAMQYLLLFLKPKMEQQTGLYLFPTYSYFRIYSKGATLAGHKDRPSCEISASLSLKGDSWPIYINGFCANLNPGDALIYRGCDYQHWRNEFTEGETLAQVFLHYVDANGQYAEWANDKHPSILNHS
tara:strand:- start:1783 stop:2319 length:537 start_codon:yes stop_codon:yes gene_type:complete